MEVMKLHALRGFESLHGCRGLERLRHVILHHCERFQDRGYPNVLRDPDIPFESRIIALADAFGARTTSRSSRRQTRVDEGSRPAPGGKGGGVAK
jgi:polar amino acid transport system substrate-binding protein